MTVLIWGEDANYFSVSSGTVPANAVNSEEGYDLEISYLPQEYGEHNTTLIIQDGGMEGSSVVYLKGICNPGTSTTPVGVQSPDMYVQNGVINFRTYAPNDRVSIYNSLGKLIYSGNGTGQWQEFKVPRSDIYIIQINGKALKAVVI